MAPVLTSVLNVPHTESCFKCLLHGGWLHLGNLWGIQKVKKRMSGVVPLKVVLNTQSLPFSLHGSGNSAIVSHWHEVLT